MEWFDDGSTISLVDLSSVKSLEEGIKTKITLSKKKQNKKLDIAIAKARKALRARKKAKKSTKQ